MLYAATAVMATTTIIVFEIRPARTTASPITSPPTMLMVCPILDGSRTPASRISSIVNSITSASIKGGNGIFLIELITGRTKSSGSTSK
ncbi:hypothetical protein D3C84_1097200 [compost metagenome]